MMKKTILSALLIFLISASAFGQEEIKPSLSSRPLFFIVMLQPAQSPNCGHCLLDAKTIKPIRKKAVSFYVDVPLSFRWQTVAVERINDLSIQDGAVPENWSETVEANKWPLMPRIGFATEDVRLKFEGGILKMGDKEFVRKMKQVDGLAEGNIWFLLVGGEAFFAGEENANTIRGLNFNADFKRESYGGNGWAGVKLGGFTSNFFAGRFGSGYIWTKGYFLFDVPGVDGLEWIDLYSEKFLMSSFSVEGRISSRWISQSVMFRRTEYERVDKLPDESGVDINNFTDAVISGETEINVIPKRGILKIVVAGRFDFEDNHSLMFKDEHSLVAVFLRVAFK